MEKRLDNYLRNCARSVELSAAIIALEPRVAASAPERGWQDAQDRKCGLETVNLLPG